MVFTLKCFVSRPSPTHFEVSNLPSKADVCEKDEGEHKDIFPVVIPRCELPSDKVQTCCQFQNNHALSTLDTCFYAVLAKEAYIRNR